MREIKFRAKWKLHPEEWLEGVPYYDGEDWMMKTTWKTEKLILPETVGQYTGLKDKNGKEIYEGDIVKGGRLRCQDGTSIQTNKATVVFKDGMFKAGSISLISINRNTEVISNIYENPDLLKE